MAVVTPSKFTVVQSYAGLKEAYFEVTATAADTIDFEANGVKGGKICILQDAGAAVDAAISGSDLNIVTVGTGPSADDLVGRILFAEQL